MFADADCEESSCDSVESDSWSDFWMSDAEAVVEEEEEEEPGAVGEEEGGNHQDEGDDGSDDSRESHIHRCCSAETVTYELDEDFLWRDDVGSDSADWPTASPDSGDDSGADELI